MTMTCCSSVRDCTYTRRAFLHLPQSARVALSIAVCLTTSRAAAQTFETTANLKLRTGPSSDFEILRVLENHAKSLRLRARSTLDKLQKGQLLEAAKERLSEALTIADSIEAGVDERARIWIGQGYLALDTRDRHSFKLISVMLLKECANLLDNVVWARIHLLLFRSTYQRLDFMERIDPPFLESAAMHAREATKFARNTQHRRIIARAEIARGLVTLKLGPSEVDRADRFADAADDQLEAYDQDYVRDELLELRRKIDQAKGRPSNPLIVYYLDDVYEKNITDLIENDLKKKIIQRTQHLYNSIRDMRDRTGLSQETVKKHWVNPESALKSAIQDPRSPKR